MNKKFLCALALILFALQMYGQSVAEKLKAATTALLNDEQFKHAIISLYVTDVNGNKVYALNEQYGLAPASTQKIFTAVAAFNALGKDFSYKTEIGYTGNIDNGNLNGNLIIKGYGDPSFGSWRYTSTKAAAVLHFITNAVQNAGIQNINGNIILDDDVFEYNATPGGYIWEDMGNYYGSGSWAINWRENQYDLFLKPGKKINDTTTILRTEPTLIVDAYKNFITTAAEKTGDNTILYLPVYGKEMFAEGTIPKGIGEFKVSGAVGYAADQLKAELNESFHQDNINVSGEIITGASLMKQSKKVSSAQTNIATYTSPTLDSLVYWFLQKSINLYGECLLKTLAYKNDSIGSTANGVYELKKFYQQNGVDSSSINIADGSGLSPQNRVTTFAMVNALLFAEKQNWFQSFYNALPVYNNMKLKSGTINSVKSFAGYNTSANGKKYVVAFIVNNYDDNKGSITQKMFKVLDALK